MIEQYLQVAIEFIKEIWFQLNTMFGLEETQAFKFLKPYLLQVQNNRAYMAIAIASLLLIAYSIYKVVSISQKREKKFNELMDEMEEEEEEEEEIDINDPRRLRRSHQDNKENSVAKESSNKNEKEDDQPIPDPPYVQVLEKMDEEEREDELHVDTQKIMGTEEVEFELESTDSELTVPETNENLNEFEEFEFDTESDDAENEDVIDKNIPHGENAKNDQTPEKQLTTEPNDLINRLKDFQENLDTRLKEEEDQDSAVEAVSNDLEKISGFVEQENFSPKTPKVSPLDKKRYMEVLESFIFLKDQNKH